MKITLFRLRQIPRKTRHVGNAWLLTQLVVQRLCTESQPSVYKCIIFWDVSDRKYNQRTLLLSPFLCPGVNLARHMYLMTSHNRNTENHIGLQSALIVSYWCISAASRASLWGRFGCYCLGTLSSKWFLKFYCNSRA